MRVCRRCNERKPLEDFPFKVKAEGLRHSACKLCCRAYSKADYVKNKTSYLQRATFSSSHLITQKQQYVWDYAKSHPCVDCGETDPVVLEFDHRENKVSSVSQMACQRTASLELLKVEIAKCDVRCANCHRRKTAMQFNWYKNVVK
jgi:hypothetical protein